MAKLNKALLVVLGLYAGQLSANQVTVCVVAQKKPKNPDYFGVATTETHLTCEIPGLRGTITLPQLYSMGWRLITVVGGASTIDRRGKGASPVYYLERIPRAVVTQPN